jgi:hypothetical protein
MQTKLRRPRDSGLRRLVSLAASGAGIALAAACGSCGSSTEATTPVDASPHEDASDGAVSALDATAAGASGDASIPAPDAETVMDGSEPGDASQGTDALADGGGLAPDRFVTGVVSFTPGPCAGFGEAGMPGIVEGPPKGGGAMQGSLDVVSLGVGGEIVLSFAPNAIVDGPGPDFIVFENAFLIGGNAAKPYAEPGEVSVSDDGTTWATYPCTATSYPYGQCAGWHAVYSAPGNGISPVDPATAGGEAYDLADVGLPHARFVRIRDKSGETCPDAGGSNTDGFDLDAISIVNAEIP